MTKILLTGANGKVSSATIEALKNAGHELIGMVRDETKAKALKIPLRVGDMTKPNTLDAAFSGIDTLWLLSPPGYTAPALMSNAIWAAKKAGIKHIVRMSAIGAAHDAPTLNGRLHALSDEELKASGIAFTILQPHFFAQNILGMAGSVKQQGTMYFALGDAKLPMIDIHDIARTAAAILANPTPHAGKTYSLTGGAAVSMAQVAAAIGEAIGKPVKYVPMPIPAAISGMAERGADDYAQNAMRDYFTAYSQGWKSEVSPSVKEITGKEPRTIAEFARENAAAFRQAPSEDAAQRNE